MRPFGAVWRVSQRNSQRVEPQCSVALFQHMDHQRRLWAGGEAAFVTTRAERTGGANCNGRFCARRRTYGKSTSKA